MPGLAAKLLEAGRDSPAVRRLAAEDRLGSRAEAEPIVAKVFGELGVKDSMNDEQAKLFSARQIAREVIAGRRNAWAAASYIEVVLFRWNPGKDIVQELCVILDELDWGEGYQRSLPALHGR